MKKENWRDWVATIGGLVTSGAMAVAGIDFNKFDWHNRADRAYFLICLLPAVGGWLSKFKGGNDVKPN